MMGISKIFKYAVIIITVIILLTFIIPYNPEDIYSNQTIRHNDPIPDIKLVKDSENTIHKSETDELKSELAEVAKVVDASGKDSQKMFIILVTGFRTGSTFLGELFNQNPEVLYLFEPFHQNHIKGLISKNAIQGKCSKIMKQKCFFY